MVQHVLEWNPGVYDSGALCAAVLFASNHQNTTYLQRPLQNRPNPKQVSHSEHRAFGLAAWSGDMEVLKTLCCQLGASVATNLTSDDVDGPYYDAFEGEVHLNDWENGNHELPFWHDDDINLEVTEPLSFILRSLTWITKLQKLGYRHDEHSIAVTINPSNEEIIKLQVLPRSPQRKKFSKEAIKDGKLAIMDLLLKAGAEVNAPAARSLGATALHLAAIKGIIGTVRMLIDMGADVNAPCAEDGGRTALEDAAEHGRIDMIQFLLTEEAETGGRNRLHTFEQSNLQKRKGMWLRKACYDTTAIGLLLMTGYGTCWVNLLDGEIMGGFLGVRLTRSIPWGFGIAMTRARIRLSRSETV
ncbi:hypothetical protein CTAM01_08434 [Colletotrichum tamarilloi]|uniref:Ankyrin repeat protein n=1 Tax=Colletotrichum tamarilloi TaxID=1209934 RepID=A0ABQ9R6A1_9PEZI|nr:uncharacterized protein CTAM01_08434 [Colletotrichum tamarilloi]KAK1496247.1 hypothetical protein CTAM01_08434 [Colletotrichum tamarilloi]